MAGINLSVQMSLNSPNNLRQVVQGIQSQLQGINANVKLNINPNAVQQINSLNNSLNNIGNTASRVRSQFTDTANSIENFGQVAGLALRRFSGFSLVAGGLVKVTSAFRDGVKEALEFDRAMIRLAQVSDNSTEGLKELEREISRLSTSLGVSSKELVNTALTLKQAGLSINDVKVAMEALAKASLSPTFDDMAKTTEGVIAIMQQFKIQAKDIEAALGSVNAVSAAFAVESKDIIEAVKRSGGAFKAVGGDLNEFMALFTAVRATTRESADSIATGLRTIFTRLQKNETVDNLKMLQVNLRYTREEASRMGDLGLENQFVGAYEAIKRLGEGLRNLRATDPRYSAVVEELGGYRHISRVIPLLQEATTIQKAYTVAQNGQVSMSMAAAKAQDGYLVKMTKVKEQFLELMRTFSQSSSFKAIIDTSLSLAQAIIKITDAMTPLLPMLTAMATIKIGANIGSFSTGLLGGIGGKSNPRLFAAGGSVPGNGNYDTVDAKLTPGEYVFDKRSVQAMGGPKVLDSMRRRLATGGLVRGQKIGQAFINPSDAPSYTLDSISLDNAPAKVKKRLISSIESYLPDSVLDKKAEAQRIYVSSAPNSSINSQTHNLVFTGAKSLNNRMKIINPQIGSIMRDGVERISGRVFKDDSHDLVTKQISNSVAGSMAEGLFATYLKMASTGGQSPIDFKGINTTNLSKMIESGFLSGSADVNNIDIKTTRVPGEAILKKALNGNLLDYGSLARDMIRESGGTVQKKKKIKGYASGGLVGGSGEGDTVRADMAPGSFVMRKSSTNSIGVGNLMKMATGGEVFEWNRGKNGGEPLLLNSRETDFTQRWLAEGMHPQDVTAALASIGKIPKGYTGLLDNAGNTKNALIRAKNAEVGLTSGKTKGGKTGKTWTVPDSPLDRLGAIVLDATSNQAGYNKRYSADMGRISEIHKRILKEQGISNISTIMDVHVLSQSRKREFAKKLTGNINDYVENAFGKEFNGVKTGDLGLNGQERDNINGILLGKYVSGITGVASNNSANADFDFDAGAFQYGKSYPFLYPNKVFAKFIDVKKSDKKLNTVAQKYLNATRILEDNPLGKITDGTMKIDHPLKRYASGGHAEGKDTVAAMLTPGEYVFSPDAVKRIGLSSLHEMNSTGKIKKFANGGFVGGFANGGSVPSKEPYAIGSSGEISLKTTSNSQAFNKNIEIMMKINSGLTLQQALILETNNITKFNNDALTQKSNALKSEVIQIQTQLKQYEENAAKEKESITKRIEARKKEIQSIEKSIAKNNDTMDSTRKKWERNEEKKAIIEKDRDLALAKSNDPTLSKEERDKQKRVVNKKNHSLDLLKDRQEELIQKNQRANSSNNSLGTLKTKVEALKTTEEKSLNTLDEDSKKVRAKMSGDMFTKELEVARMDSRISPIKDSSANINDVIMSSAEKSLVSKGLLTNGAKIGQGNLDSKTESKMIEDKYNLIKNQLVEAEKERLAVILPNIDKIQRESLAIEGVEAALKKNMAVVTDANGKIINFEHSLTSSNSLSTIAATAVGNQSNNQAIADLNEHTKGKKKNTLGQIFKERMGGIGLFAAGTGLSYLSEGIGPRKDMTEEQIVASQDSYSNKKTASSTLSGIATGAMAGSAFGIWGAAVGALVGGITSAASAMHEAASDIAKAQIGVASKRLSGELNRSSFSGVSASGRMSDIDRDIYKYADNESFSLWNSGPLGESEARKQSRTSLRRAKSEEIYSQQLPNFSKVLGNEAERIGKSNFDKEIFSTSGGSSKFEQLLLEGSQGFNRQMLEKIAELRNIPVKDVLKEFVDIAKTSSRKMLEDISGRKGNEGFNLFVNHIHRFNDSLSLINLSTQKLSKTFENISEEFSSGKFSPEKMSDMSGELNNIGKNSPEFTKAIQVIANSMGENKNGQMSESGKQFYEISNAVDKISYQLPRILEDVMSGEYGSGQDFATATRNKLKEVFPEGNNQAIDAFIAKLTQKMTQFEDLGKARKAMGEAGGAFQFSKTLVGPEQDAVVKSAAEAMAKLVQSVNELSSSFANYQRMIDQIDAEKTKVSQMGLDKERIFAGIEAASSGRRESDLISRQKLLKPFQERQNRLAPSDLFGIPMDSTFNVDILEQKASRKRSQIDELTKQKDAQNAAGNQPEVLRLTSEISQAAAELNNFKKAISNAGDAAKAETQLIMDKIKSLQAEQSQRMSIAETLLYGTQEDKQEIYAGARLDNNVRNAPNQSDAISRLSDTDKKRLQNYRKKTSQTVGFDGRTGSEADIDAFKSSKTLAQIISMPELDKAKKDLGASIDREIAAANKVVNSFEELAEYANKINFDLLNEKMNMLAKDMKNREIEGIRTNISAIKQQKEGLGLGQINIGQAESFANKFGLVKNDGKIDFAKFNATKELAEANKRRYQVIDDKNKFYFGKNDVVTNGSSLNINKNKFEDDILQKVKSAATTSGGSLSPEQEKLIRSNIRRFIENNAKDVSIKGQDAEAVEKSKEMYASYIQREIRERLDKIYKNASNIDLGGIGKAADNYTNIISEGRFNSYKNADDETKSKVDKITQESQTVSPKDYQKYEEALKNIEKSGLSFAVLQKKIKELEDAFKSLNNQLIEKVKDKPSTGFMDSIGKQIYKGEKLASGGIVGMHPGKPSGSDTVPAWLTPGEGVIKASAMTPQVKNLVSNLNRGAKFFADGGEVDLDWGRKKTEEMFNTPARAAALAERNRKFEIMKDNQKILKQYMVQVKSQNKFLNRGASMSFIEQNDSLSAENMQIAKGFNSLNMRRANEEFKKTDLSTRIFQGVASKNMANLGRVPEWMLGKGNVQGFNNGGVVPGAGFGDIVNARLEPGEFVMPKSSVAKHGLAKMQYFANGGQVQPSFAQSSGSGFKIEVPQELMSASQLIASAFNSAVNPMNMLSESMNKLPQIVDKLASIPHKIDMSIAPINVIVTMPDMSGMEEGMKKGIMEAMERMVREKLTDLLNSGSTPVL